MALEILQCLVDANENSDVVTVTDVVLTPDNCRKNAAVGIDGVPYFVEALLSTTTFQLTRDFAEADATDLVCEIAPFTPEMSSRAVLSKQVTNYDAKLSLVSARGYGLFYNLVADSGSNDPGPGNLSVNNVDWSLVTEVRIDVLDAAGIDATPEIDDWSDGTELKFESIETGSFEKFAVTEEATNQGPDAWRRMIGLGYIGGSGALVVGEALRIVHVRNGSGLEISATGTFAGRDAHDDEPKKFVYLSTDGDGDENSNGVIFIKISAASADWSAAVAFQGPTGHAGWSPNYDLVTDNNRIVEQLAGYVGGGGVAPIDNIGSYRATAGGYTINIALAKDVRGDLGVNWRDGIYDAGTAFLINDAILDNGSSWRALQATTGNAPPVLPATSNAFWALIAGAGADGAGTGNVVGPAGVTDGAPVLFDGTTGKLIKPGAYASQAEAEAGADAVKFMTPATTLQAISANAVSDITADDLLSSYFGAQAAGQRVIFGAGVADAFASEIGVDAGSSSNEIYDAGDDSYSPLVAETTTATVTLDSDGTDSSITFRNIFDAAQLSTGGVQVRVTVRGPSAGVSKTWNNVFIGHQAVAGDDYDYEVAPTRLTFGGLNSVTPAVATEVASDWVDFTLDDTVNLIVAVDTTGSAQFRRTLTAGAGKTCYYKSVADDADMMDASGYLEVAGRMYAVVKIEVRAAPADMVLISNTKALAEQPDATSAMVLIADATDLTENSDFVLSASRDGGTTMTAGLVVAHAVQDDGLASYSAEIDISGQPDGSNLVWQVETANGKNVEVAGVVIQALATIATQSWWPDGSDYAADFENDRYMVDDVEVALATAITSFTRDTVAMAVNSAGVWSEFAVDVMAVTDLGVTFCVAVTHADTNSEINGLGGPSTYPTLWAGYPADSISVENDGSGVEDGLHYFVYRLFGTATATSQTVLSFNTPTSNPAAPGEDWSAAVRVRIVGGSKAGLTTLGLVITEYTDGGGWLDYHQSADGLSALNGERSLISISSVMAHASTLRNALALTVGWNIGAVIDVTLRIYMPALAKTDQVPIPHPTAGTGAVVRGADVPTLAFPAGTRDLVYKYDNGSEQTVDDVAGGDYAIDVANLQRPGLKSAVRSAG